ncbi:HNH endonuclease [Paenibacillus pabuli]|uniref:HNH endonuclease n=1 Tax=Paenibacillus pabuli TaxID=1472 RepID=UPI0009E96C0C|nr:restriction endonuclease [Paenibacillus pabuli]MEC0127079.1 HNH endonuclease [Paenibacillus pabuli]
MNNRCELCGREPVDTTVHHLTPKEMGGTLMPIAHLCIPCHKQIHSLYTNRDLVTLGLTDVQALRQDERVAPYIRWIRKQPATTIPRVRKSQHVRKS